MRLNPQSVPPWTRGPIAVLVVFLAYTATGWLGLRLAIPPGYATAVWPPSGLALAAVLLCGYRIWPAIVLGSFCLHLGAQLDATTTVSVFKSVGIAATIGFGTAAQAALGAFFVERFVDDPAAFVREEQIIKFLLVAGPLASLLSGTVAVTVLVLGGALPVGVAWFTWCTWWVGDTIGAILFAPLALVWTVKSPEMTQRRRLSVSVPILIMFAIAVVAFAYASDWEQYRLDHDFARRSESIVQTMRKAIDSDLDALYATRGLLLTRADVDRDSFRQFTERYLGRQPGLRSITWAAWVRAEGRAEFEKLGRRSLPDFEIREWAEDGVKARAAPRPEYLVVDFVEPIESGRAEIGFDVLSEPVRREAALRARATGQAVATPSLALPLDPRPHAGFLVFLPVARPVDGPRGDRRGEAAGCVVGEFQIGDVMSASLRGVSREGIDLAVYEGKQLLYRSPGSPMLGEISGANVAIVKSMPFDVAGRAWSVSLSVPYAYALANRSLQAWTVLASGVLFTALFGAFLLVLTGRTALVEGVVRQRTADLERVAEDRRRAADALRQSEEQFRTLSTASPLGIFRTDAGGGASYVNPCWQAMAGLEGDEGLGDGWIRAVHPEDRERVRAAWQDAMRGQVERFDIELRFQNGDRTRHVFSRAAAVRSAAGELLGYVGTIEDITDSKQAEQALRESEERYRMLAEQSSDFISRHRLCGLVTYASPACRALCGYEPEEIVGRSGYDFYDPADIDASRQKLREAIEGDGTARLNYRVRCKNGETVWVESSVRVLRDPVTQQPNEVLAVTRDVSERKRAERMRQDLVAMLSHDLKNPLTAVLGFAEILRDTRDDDSQRDEFLARIEANAHSALSLANNFVDASQIESGALQARLEPVFVNETVEQVLRQQESRAKVKQIRLGTRLDGSRPIASLDRRLIDRVIANLVNNAIKFSPTGTQVTVETTRRDGRVAVRVLDQGPGIAPDQRSKLFQKFSDMRSRRPDSAGLGLFIVKTLVDAQGGEVRTEFPASGGTIFEVSFPAADDAPRVGSRPSAAAES